MTNQEKRDYIWEKVSSIPQSSITTNNELEELADQSRKDNLAKEERRKLQMPTDPPIPLDEILATAKIKASEMLERPIESLTSHRHSIIKEYDDGGLDLRQKFSDSDWNGAEVFYSHAGNEYTAVDL